MQILVTDSQGNQESESFTDMATAAQWFNKKPNCHELEVEFIPESKDDSEWDDDDWEEALVIAKNDLPNEGNDDDNDGLPA